MIIRLKYYHDSLNLAVTVALGCQVVTFSLLSMCLILFNIYGKKLNKGGFSSKTVMIHFWNKPYEEINFKSHIVYYVVNKEKYCPICTCSV